MDSKLYFDAKYIIPEENSGFFSKLNGTNVNGSYSTMQFVLRLRDDVRAALEQEDDDGFKTLAMSTNIHENIHWWQHIGSNFGFLYSLAYPAFIGLSIKDLKALFEQGLAYKSLLKFDSNYYTAYNKADMPDLNAVLNNYYDLEYAKRFILNNKSLAEISQDKRFFLNIGHCFHVFWSSTIDVLSSTLDENHTFLPDPDKWFENFEKMAEDKVEGFYIDSDMHVSNIGLQAVYEGQAIFNQLQYLTIALNRDLTYEDFENKGLLHGIYTEAFDHFRAMTGLPKPDNVLHPIVSLFLLVCDISINPNNGFPLNIYDYENFINKNDPGLRFTLLAFVISKDPEYYVSKINLYSKEEYITLCEILGEKTGCVSVYDSIKTTLSWFKQEAVKKLLTEECELKYSDKNMPIRLLFSKFLRFQEDKYEHPNVFCWIGYHAAGESKNIDFEIVNDLFQKHHALYTDSYNGQINPVIFKNYKKENILETFNKFYGYNLIYETTLKWINEEGEFKYDYDWLTDRSKEEMVPMIKDGFSQTFGYSPDEIKIV